MKTGWYEVVNDGGNRGINLVEISEYHYASVV